MIILAIQIMGAMNKIMKTIEVPSSAIYAAFAKGGSAFDYKLDELRFNEFQKGWNAALDFVNAFNSMPDDTDHTTSNYSEG